MKIWSGWTQVLDCPHFTPALQVSLLSKPAQFRGSLFMAVGVGRTEKSGPRALLTLYWCHDQCPQSSLPLKKTDVSETDYRWLSWLHKGQMEISRGSVHPSFQAEGPSGGALPSQSHRLKRGSWSSEHFMVVKHFQQVLKQREYPE